MDNKAYEELMVKIQNTADVEHVGMLRYKIGIDVIFEQFRNNVFCRRESNQRKARTLWRLVRKTINDSDEKLFETEWSHYTMGEIELNDFSLYFDKYVKKHFL
jgi:hypothetical protein